MACDKGPNWVKITLSSAVVSQPPADGRCSAAQLFVSRVSFAARFGIVERWNYSATAIRPSVRPSVASTDYAERPAG